MTAVTVSAASAIETASMRGLLAHWQSRLLAVVVAVFLFRAGSLRHVHAANIDVLAQAELRELVTRSSVGGLATDLSQQIQKFYLLSGYSLAWSRNGVLTAQALAIGDLLKNAHKKGLPPEEYGTGELLARMTELSSGKSSYRDLAGFDLKLTTAVIHFATDVSVGRIDPSQLQFALDSQRKSTEIPDFLVSRLIHAQDPPAVMAELEPPFAGYRRTEAALARYLEMAKAGEDPKLPIPAKPSRVGEPYAGARALAQRLTRLGDLADTGTGQELIYSVSLADSVKHFQERHGLAANGVLDQSTIVELNRPISGRVLQLELTLERWRWLPFAFSQPPIVVNIPEFKLRAYDENHHIALRMPVIVGKAYKNQTPVFQEDMEYVSFRPFWNVPLSIVRSELIPEIEKNPAHFSKENFEIIRKDGTPLSTDRLSTSMLRQLGSGELEVRQRPGRDNALGLIKFIFPNHYYVYLHGTPAQQLFRHPRRDFSHGCIRVADPVALAAWVLRSDLSWTAERVREAMNGDDSMRVKLPKPIPVLILYGTAIVEENGDVHFFHDIYGHDRALVRAIEDHSKRDQGL